MKKFVLFFAIAFAALNSHAQVGIGTATPNANAKLDITDQSKGLLIPRMDSVHRKAIPNTVGMMVYDSSYKSFYYNNGTVWQRIASGAGVVPSGQNPGDILYWNGTSWAVLPVGLNGQSLHICNGALTWNPVCVPPGINLTTSPLQFNFDGIGAALPQGVTVNSGASATAAGAELPYNNTNNYQWSSVAAGARSYASATGLVSSTDSATQAAATDRALGVRQTSGTGDPGAAFVFQFENTTGKSNFQLQFLLQSLDVTSPRTVTWSVDYGLGTSPATFTAATPTGTLTTGGATFTSNTINVNFGNALDNNSGKVWVRIVALANSTGSGSRPTTAIDNVRFSWN